MKKILLLSLILTRSILIVNAQNDEEYSEQQTIEKREQHKEAYEIYNGKVNTIKEASLVWNEYFEYAKNMGPNALSAHGSWTNICCDSIQRPGSIGSAMGRMNCVRTDPSNVNIVYAGSPSGGLWKSVNGGDTWSCLTDGLPRVGITDVAVNPANGNEIYILTGDGEYGLSPCIGILKSFNGGFTWQPTGLMFVNNTALNFNDSISVYGRKLIISPAHPNVLYAATTNGIYKTSDSGNNWSLVYPSVDIADINFKPAYDTVIYASGAETFYKSVTGGLNWSSLSIDTSGARISLSTTIAAPTNVYLLVSLEKDRVRSYLSIDNGTTFAMKADTPNVIQGQQKLDIAVEASPANASTVYAGVLDFYRSGNSGLSFTLKSSGSWGGNNYVHVDIHDIEVRNGVIYIASDGGIYKSTDGGNTWQEKNNGLSVAWITSLAHSSTFPDLFYFGSWDNGLYKRTTGAIGQPLYGGDGMSMTMDPGDQNIAYGNINFGYLKTTDGLNFLPLATPSTTEHRLLVVDKTNPNNIYLASNEVYKSPNKGDTWTPLLSDSSYGRCILGVAVSNPDFVYSATRPHPYSPGDFPTYFQRYNGSGWTNCKGNLPDIWTFYFCPSDIAIDPSNHLHVWVTFSDKKNGLKVFETIDGGTIWANRSGTLPNVEVTCIEFAPGSRKGVYIGTDVGVFYKDSTFTDWVPFLNGMPRTKIIDLVIDPGTNSIYAATCGRGLWQSDLFSSCPVSYSFTGSPYNTQSGYQFYEASNIIESDRYIDGSYGNNIIYKSGSYVNFIPGFEAIAGSEVVAKIGTCSGFPLAIPMSGNYEGEQNSQSGITAINQLKIDKPRMSLNIYPEPHTDFVTMEFVSADELPVTIVITDILGHTIESIIKNESFAVGNHSLQISTAHHKRGIYAVTFTQGKNTFTRKIVKL